MPSHNSIVRFLGRLSESITAVRSGRSSRRNRFRLNAVPSACDVLESRQLLTATLTGEIAGQQISGNADSFNVTLANHFDDTDVEGSVVQIQTTSGTFYVETYDEITPLTATNFLNLVEGGNYDDMFFHRLVSGFVLQGGGFQFPADAEQISDVSHNGTVDNEFDNWFDPELGGLEDGDALNLRGTLAMAKLGGNPDSATSQWFVNVGDNSENLDNQNGGFTVFARVLYDGMDVVDDLMSSTVVNAGGSFTALPVVDWEQGESLLREHLTLTTSTVASELTYGVTVTSGSEYVQAAVVDGVLTVTGTEAAASASGYAEVVVSATDVAGNVVQDTFRVAIGVPADTTVTGPLDVVTGQAVIEWQASDGATTYDLWISKMNDLAPTTVESAGIIRSSGLTGTSHAVAESLEAGIYRAWVRPQNDVGAGAWTQPFEFVVGLSQPEQVSIDSVTPDETNSKRVTVEWADVDQATQYQVWISDSTGTTVVNELVSESAYSNDFDLTSGESYRAWVRAVNRRFDGSWSSVRSFGIDLNTDPVTITNPTLASGIADSSTPLIEWTSEGNHQNYDIWVSQVGTSGAYLRETSSTSSFQSTTAWPDGIYQVWVRPPAATGIAWSSPVTIGIGTQATVTGATESANSIYTISWTAGIPNTTTQLWVNGPTGRVLLETGLTGTSFQTPAALPDGAYTAWVRQAPSAGGVFQWSTGFQFEVGESTTPGTPALSASVDGSTISFSWQSVANGVRYELWVNSPSTTKIVSETELLGTNFQATLTESGTYRAWLRAFNSDGVTGNWSSVELFDV